MKKLQLKNSKAWNELVKNNKDSYGKCCIDVARRAMEILDANEKIPDDVVLQASKELEAGITGFMAGCVAAMISKCHVRGDEFRKIWNIDQQINDEGEKANKKKDGILNPALITIKE